MEDTGKAPFWKPALNYALIMAAVSIFLTLAFYFTDIYLKGWASVVNGLISIAVLVYLLIQYRDKVLGGYASFGQLFVMGLVASLISLVIGMAFGMLQQYVLFPEMQEAILLNAQEKILNNTRIPESMVDQQLERVENMMQPGRQVLLGLVGGTFFNAIILLVIAAILKKEESIVGV